MLKVGKLVNTDQQLCFAHGIHLALYDVLNNEINAQNELTANDRSK